MAKHGLTALFGRGDAEGGSVRTQARRLRAALEELGPTFAKLGQVPGHARAAACAAWLWGRSGHPGGRAGTVPG
jgi:hypothetical protein